MYRPSSVIIITIKIISNKYMKGHEYRNDILLSQICLDPITKGFDRLERLYYYENWKCEISFIWMTVRHRFLALNTAIIVAICI